MKHKTLSTMLATVLVPGFMIMSNDASVKASSEQTEIATESENTIQEEKVILPSIDTAFVTVKKENGETEKIIATSSDLNSYSVDLTQLSENDRFIDLHIVGADGISKLVLNSGILGEKEISFSDKEIVISPSDFNLDPQNDGVSFGKIKEVLGDTLNFKGTIHSNDGVISNVSISLNVKEMPQIENAVEKGDETDNMSAFKETRKNEVVNIGSINAKKISDTEAVAEINQTIDKNSLALILEDLKVELKNSLGTNVEITPLIHSDVTEGKAVVATNTNIPFASIDRDTNTIQFLSTTDKIDIKITLK